MRRAKESHFQASGKCAYEKGDKNSRWQQKQGFGHGHAPKIDANGPFHYRRPIVWV